MQAIGCWLLLDLLLEPAFLHCGPIDHAATLKIGRSAMPILQLALPILLL